MKNIRVVRKNGELVIKKQGTEWDVKELVTCITTDRVVREGEGSQQVVYIYCAA